MSPSAEGRLSTQTKWSTEARWTGGQGRQAGGAEPAVRQSLSFAFCVIHPDYLSVPCASSHVPSLVEQWCLQ